VHGRSRRLLLPLLGAASLALAGCSADVAPSHGIRIVAAENFWASIATQLVGSHGTVRAIISSPSVDPHSYQPTAADARLMAAAQIAVVDGLNYDPWATRLLAAQSGSGRVVLNVGRLLSLPGEANPHRWYDPADVQVVAAGTARNLERLDPGHASAYAAALAHFEQSSLASYHSLIARIRDRYAGVPVGASESIFALLAPSLALHLLTPASFMDAISEGTDVTAADTLRTQSQITSHQIKVWIYNSQNTTPAVQHLNALAAQNHIPVVRITETLTPARATFQQWQVDQLTRLMQALHQSTGR
jgi:zinc/manganese transport system substrate-binding protein